MIYRTVSIALLGCAAAFAQLESAIITGATAPAAAKAGQTAAKGISSTMGKAAAALGAAAAGSSPSSGPVAGTTGGAPIAAVSNPNVSYAKADFKVDDVQVGMTREELVAVAGKPYSKITIPIEGGASERSTYRMKNGGSVRIVLELDKVTEITLLP